MDENTESTFVYINFIVIQIEKLGRPTNICCKEKELHAKTMYASICLYLCAYLASK